MWLALFILIFVLVKKKSFIRKLLLKNKQINLKEPENIKKLTELKKLLMDKIKQIIILILKN